MGPPEPVPAEVPLTEVRQTIPPCESLCQQGGPRWLSHATGRSERRAEDPNTGMRWRQGSRHETPDAPHLLPKFPIIPMDRGGYRRRLPKTLAAQIDAAVHHTPQMVGCRGTAALTQAAPASGASKPVVQPPRPGHLADTPYTTCGILRKSSCVQCYPLTSADRARMSHPGYRGVPCCGARSPYSATPPCSARSPCPRPLPANAVVIHPSASSGGTLQRFRRLWRWHKIKRAWLEDGESTQNSATKRVRAVRHRLGRVGGGDRSSLGTLYWKWWTLRPTGIHGRKRVHPFEPREQAAGNSRS